MQPTMPVHSGLSETDALRLKSAVLLYTSGADHSRYFTSETKPTLATIHDVQARPGQAPLLGAGRMLTRDVLDVLLRNLNGLPQKRQILPERILLCDGARMAWWVPSARRPLFFKTGDDKFTREMQGKEVWQPALLMMAEPGALHVFALAENARPHAETPLFRAPYFNVWTPGKMCNGNVRLPQQLSPADMPAWEKAFFETTFTSSNGGKLTSHPEGHNGLWRGCAEAKAFPARHLVALTDKGSNRALTAGEVVCA